MVVAWRERADSVAVRRAGTGDRELVRSRFERTYAEWWVCCVFLRGWTG